MQSLSHFPQAAITRLPNELIWNIVQLLDLEDAFVLGMSCRFFRDIMRDDSICRSLVEVRSFPYALLTYR
jgi:hypothetical protein